MTVGQLLHCKSDFIRHAINKITAAQQIVGSAVDSDQGVT
jgi:hypothetical protein